MPAGIASCPGSTPQCGRHAAASGSDADDLMRTLRELAPESCPYCGEPIGAIVDETATGPLMLSSTGAVRWGTW